MIYRMRDSADCGPAAISAATGLDYDLILSRWPGGWRGGDAGDRGRFGSPNDTPYDHFALLENLGIPWKIVTCGDILAGRATPKKTLVLIHAPASPMMGQHWTVLDGIGKGCVGLHWGDGTIRRPTHAEFAGLYAGGWPACAYVVGDGEGRLSRWQRFVAFLTGRFV